MHKNNTNCVSRYEVTWSLCWIFAGFVLAFFALNAAKPNASTSPGIDSTQVSRLDSARRPRLRALQSIETVKVGDRVHVDITENQRELATGRIGGREWDRESASIVMSDWKVAELTMNGKHGDVHEIALLRPTDWFESSGAAVGKQIQLTIPEQGLNGPAAVTNIRPCPEVIDGPGRVVTGTFTHIRGGILRLYIEGVDPIGVTGSHPIYSVSEGDFVYASDLKQGDVVQLLDGPSRVTQVEPVDGEQRVFNLEVRGDHVYHVTDAGLLVHNASEHGSYTVYFSDGTHYHGKGSRARSEVSARREVKAHNAKDPDNPIQHTATDWKPAPSSREAFKAEARRIAGDPEGVADPINRNRINSPGKKYLEQDGS